MPGWLGGGSARDLSTTVALVLLPGGEGEGSTAAVAGYVALMLRAARLRFCLRAGAQPCGGDGLLCSSEATARLAPAYANRTMPTAARIPRTTNATPAAMPARAFSGASTAADVLGALTSGRRK